jgi:hypothetical protein
MGITWDDISGNVVGKNIAVGPGTVNVSEAQLQKLPNRYAQSLKDFSTGVNEHLKGQQIPEEQIKEVNYSLNSFAKEVEGIKPEEENNVNLGKRRDLNRKFGNIIHLVVKALPTAARIAPTLFAPLAPFSGLIGESVEQIVSDYTK